MKIRLLELRKIIREVIDQQSVVPGKWDPVSLDPLDPEDLALMTTVGLGDEDEDKSGEDTSPSDKHVSLGEAKKKKKKGLWANIHAKRARGEAPAKPGEEGYPKTLDI